MNQADLVEEQELKERIVEKAIVICDLYHSIALDSFKEIQALVQSYLIVRDRNNETRREEYNGRFKEIQDK